MISEKFKELGLSGALLNRISEKGFEEPTEIQKLTIPLLLSSDIDIIAQARTGTGKTAAFGLPVMDRLEPCDGTVQALVLVPTRELAIQVAEELNSFKEGNKPVIYPIYGGQSMGDQIRRLKKGVDIVIGTPGRINDHIRRKTLKLDGVSMAVLDEADEMLNMGFIDEVREILSHTNTDRRTLLFSATMSPHVMGIAKEYMKQYTVVAEKEKQQTVNNTEQKYFEMSRSDRLESLCRVVDIEDRFYGLVFCRTRADVDELTQSLQAKGYGAEGIHGDFSQQQRERVLAKFKKGNTGILVATDVAARGIDINDLTHVVNYALPQDTESYIHRIGRTGRAGRKGTAITFVAPSEHRKLVSIIKTTGADIKRENVPEINDIMDAKRRRMADELSAIIDKGSHGEFVDSALHLLAGHDPVDMIAALLKHSKKGELDRGRYREIKKTRVNAEAKQGKPRRKREPVQGKKTFRKKKYGFKKT